MKLSHGENSKRDAIKSNEIFPQNYNVYRNDRGTLDGGVFVLAEKSLTSVEQTQFITDGELEWVKIKLLKNKDLLVGSFYIPHRQHQHLDQLKLSLERSEANKQNIILAGDFNCPNINWEQQTATGPDREIQQELMSFHNLTQVHNQPTREGNLLDLVFVSNPTLVKSLTNVPGISDHDMIITDMETRVYHQKSKLRKCFIYNKADWTTVHKDLSNLNNNI